MAYNFQTGNKIEQLSGYESVTQGVVFGNTVFTALTSGGKYDVMLQNGDCSKESNVRTLVFGNKAHYQKTAYIHNSLWRRSTSR
jgi:hypothetical protein